MNKPLDKTVFNQELSSIRREYGTHDLDHSLFLDSPITKSRLWLEDAINIGETDPNAMVISTVDAKGHPDARVVLLKEIRDQGFVFFTHYDSAKGSQLEIHPFASLTFYWAKLARQLRVRGSVAKISSTESSQYFKSRPWLSQISALVSMQSRPIPSREFLETKFYNYQQDHSQNNIQCPDNWGGYVVAPYEIEFWQGCDNRLHDRLKYTLSGQEWHTNILAP